MPDLRNPFEERKAAAEGRTPNEPQPTAFADGEKRARARPDGPRVGGLVFSAIAGFVSATVIAFTNVNYEKFRADDAVPVAMALGVLGLGLFAIFAIGVIRRMFSAKYRARVGWSGTTGFLMGLGTAALALAFAGPTAN